VVNVKILSRYGYVSEEFCDPGSWDAASYWPDMASEIDGALDLAPNSYRERSLSCLAVVKAIDEFVSQSSNARLAWIGVSLGLGLDSTRGMTAAEIARQLECSEQMVRGSTSRFLKLTGLPPANGKFASWI
jgi:hypothetical protein